MFLCAGRDSLHRLIYIFALFIVNLSSQHLASYPSGLQKQKQPSKKLDSFCFVRREGLILTVTNIFCFVPHKICKYRGTDLSRSSYLGTCFRSFESHEMCIGTFLLSTHAKTRIHGFSLCAGRDSNPRRHKSFGLQPNAIDHSATDAFIYIC